MKLQIDIKGRKPMQNDVIFYQDGHWIAMNKIDFLGDTDKYVRTLESEIHELRVELSVFKEKVNSKLNDYHNILNVLTKGEE